MTATAHTRTVTRRLAGRLACDRGFTIVELLVASVVLIVGMLGVLVLLTGSLQMTATNNERVGATNLARELVEATRSLDYADMTGARVQTRLQARGLGAGTPWLIERRFATYTVSAASCTFDSPTDGLAASPPEGVCLPQPPGPVGDANGDDFRRTTFTDQLGRRRDVAPRLADDARRQPVRRPRAADRRLHARGADDHRHRDRGAGRVDDDDRADAALDGRRRQELGLGHRQHGVHDAWALGTAGSGSEVLDGSYEITGQPFDDRDVAGEAKRVNVVLNRRPPYAPPSLAGGHDTRLDDWVDLEWGRNRERDILGYRAAWSGADGTAGTGDDEQVCPAPGDGWMLDPAITSCSDFSPPPGAATYYVAAVDRAPDNSLREGERRRSRSRRRPRGRARRSASWRRPSPASRRSSGCHR